MRVLLLLATAVCSAGFIQCDLEDGELEIELDDWDHDWDDGGFYVDVWGDEWYDPGPCCW
jgi:hypothetical protein